MAAVLKALYTIAIALAVHISYTPPFATPKVVKQPTPGTLGSMMVDRFALSSLTIAKSAAWITGITESLIILSLSFPPSTTRLAFLPSVRDHFDINLHTTHFSVVGGLLILIGTAIRISCYRTLRNFHTFRMCIVKDHKLVTTGPYSVVRHPSYTGIILVWTGVIFWYFSPGSVLVEAGGNVGKMICAICTALSVRIMYGFIERIAEEDEMLRGAFGAEWDRWAKLVPNTLVPGLL